MSAEYRFRFSEDHLVTSALRYRQQIWWRRPFHALKWVIALALLLLFGVAAASGSIVGGGVIGAALGVLLLGWPIDAWILRRRFRKSPFHNSDIIFSLAEEGAHVVGSNEETRIGWTIYTKARRFRDGLLLFQGPHLFNWLPDSAAAEPSTVTHAQELVRARVKDYRDV